MAEEIEVSLVVDNTDGKAKLDEFAAKLSEVGSVAEVTIGKLQEGVDDGTFGESATEEVTDFGDAVMEVNTATKETKETLGSKVDGGVFSQESTDQVEAMGEAVKDVGRRATRTQRDLDKIGKDKKSFPQMVSDKLKDLGGVIGNMLPRSLRGLQRSFKQAQRGTRSFTKGLGGMKKALISTGIGALVVALGELVANWDRITGAINSASDETQALLESANGMKEQADAQLESIEATTNQLILQGKTEEEIAAMKAQALDDQIIASEMQLQFTRDQAAEQQATIERNHKIAMGLLGLLEAPLVAMLGLVDTISGAMADLGIITEGTTLATDFLSMQADMLGFDVDEQAEENAKRIAEAEEELNKLVERRAANKVRRNKERKAAEDQTKKEQQRTLDEQKKFLDKQLQQEAEYGKSQNELAVLRLQASQKAERERAEELNLSQEDVAKMTAMHEQQMTDLVARQDAERTKITEDEIEKVNAALRSDEDNRIKAVEGQYAVLIKLAEKNGLDTKELIEKMEAEKSVIRMKAAAGEKDEASTLARELELLNMSDADAQLARQRDQAEKVFNERMVIAMGNAELEKEVRAQFAADLKAIDDQEQENYLSSRREMFDAMQDFVGKASQLYSQLGGLVEAQAEAEIIAAKARGASDEELEALQKQQAEREKKMAITQVLLSQGMAIAQGLAGATAAAAATGPAAPFTLAAYIATMVGTIVAGFAQVKSIMNRAAEANLPDPSSSAGAGQGRPTTQALVPNLVSDLSNDDRQGEGRSEASFKTYVVASDVQGQNDDYGTILQNATL